MAEMIPELSKGEEMFMISDRISLISKLRDQLASGDREIVFVVGSGLTRGTVPGVNRLIDFMRSSLKYQDDQLRFDEFVGDPSGAGAYQRAAAFIHSSRSLRLLNNIIRVAVLRAFDGISSKEASTLIDNEAALQRIEERPGWLLDRGVRAFGELLLEMPEEIRGPVITTNFDPLIEIAVREASGVPLAQAMDGDGRIVQLGSGIVKIVHVHGYWCFGDTLHTDWQLTRSRPVLDGSLRDLLHGKQLVVMGYGGWDDVFTQWLVERARQKDRHGMEVAWTSNRVLSEESFQAKVFQEIEFLDAVVFYQQVDVNTFLPELLGAYQQLNPSPIRSAALSDWTQISPSYLSLRSQPRKAGSRVSFFDGREPDWSDATDPGIPRLSLVSRIMDQLRWPPSSDRKRIILLIGPAGEGKSLAFRQAVARAAEEMEDIQVLWREPGGMIDAEAISNLPRNGKNYLLCAEEADLWVEPLSAVMRAPRPRDDIRFLLCAQERDWRYRSGFARLGIDTVLVTPQLSEGDAVAVVEAWRACGASGLGELATVPETEQSGRLTAATQSNNPVEGSLLGAMLKLRYGAGLEARVRDLLDRLDKHPRTAAISLTDAFLMIALIDAIGQHQFTLSREILAKAIEGDRNAVDYLVLEPLGKEALAKQHAGHVFTRHPAIAEAAVRIARKERSAQFLAVIDRLVRCAVQDSNRTGKFTSDHRHVAYLGSALPTLDEALLAIDAAIEERPQRLTYHTERVHILRMFKQYEEADQVAAALLAPGREYEDPESIAGLLSEWATVCGVNGHPAINVLLDAAVCDPPVGYPSPEFDARGCEHYRRALLGMGAALMALHRQTHDELLLRALSESLHFVQLLRMDWTDQRFFNIQCRYLASNGSPLVLQNRITTENLQQLLDNITDSLPEDLPAVLRGRHVSVSKLKLIPAA
ncbi:P-loop NTPase [Kitasatospora sp. NPDC054939]